MTAPIPSTERGDGKRDAAQATRTTGRPPVTDAFLLTVGRVLRSFAFGFATVLLGVQLQNRGLGPVAVGVAIAIGIAAASVTGLIWAKASTRLGRRWTLAAIGILMAVSGFDLAFVHQDWVLEVAGLTGMLGAAGPDLGPFLPLEQAILADTGRAQERNRIFGRYALVGALAASLGSLSASVATDAARMDGFFVAFGIIGIVTAGLALLLSPRVERPRESKTPRVGNLRPVLGLSALFSIDSLGSGFIGSAVIVYWLHIRFGATPAVLGPAFSVMALCGAVGLELSWRLANRFGLINTMVFTHLPGTVLLLAVPFVPTLDGVLVLLIVRSLLAHMDEPTEQAYVASIVAIDQRAGALALTGGVRGIAAAFGPIVTTFAIQSAAYAIPFFLAGGAKLAYDVVLYAGFRHRRGDHELEESIV